MIFGEPGFPQKNNESEKLPREENANFVEPLEEIEGRVALINATGDALDKESKLKALAIIGELRVMEDPEKKKELISELRTAVGMIDVFKGDDLDKDAKSKAQALIETLK
jgi:hypothetical protein